MTYSVGADVGGAPVDADSTEDRVDSSLDDIALAVANHARGGDELGALGVLASAGGVEDGKELALGVVGSAVTGHSAPGAGDGAAAVRGDLGQGVARAGHGGSEVGDLELAAAGRLAETIGLGLVGLAAKDGRVRLGGSVLAEARNRGTLDAESSAVATSVASDDLDVAVGADEASGGKGENEDRLGVHFGRMIWINQRDSLK